LDVRKAITVKLRNVEIVSTDCWSVRERSYIRVTAHWINETVDWRSAALPCKRLRGSHKVDVLAS